MNYVIYNTSTGEIHRNVLCPEAMISLQLGEGESYIKGEGDDENQKVDLETLTLVPK